jgi:hypothetical protein
MGAWTEIVDFTFTANETSRSFTGLNITKDDFIKVVATFVNGVSANNEIRILPNNSIDSNFTTQRLLGDGTSVIATRDNLSRLAIVQNGETCNVTSYLKLSENDRFNFFSNYNRRQDSITNVFTYGTSSGATFTSGITSLTFTNTQNNGIGTGSRIQIYRLDAEKVADITTTANATQVDISDLSIGKDDEYLLVSDVLDNSVANSFQIMVNDNTTATNYYSQRIQGVGTSASASRVNSARVGYVDSDNQNYLSYAHIKLSEIGAYTSQNYSIQNAGTSTLALRNEFISSTAENITSITKINMVGATNGFGAGSRFHLYKLK